MNRLTNKWILITGTTSGIGKASARLFAQYKSNIIITGRRKGRLERLKHELAQQYSLKVLTSCFDIHNRNACKSLVNSIDP